MRAYYENGIEDAAGRLGLTKLAFGASLMRGAASMLGRAGTTVAKGTAIGAGLGAGVQGGLEAYNAEDGQRGEAFLHGAGQGALAGGAVGAGAGALGAAGNRLAIGAERGLSKAIGKTFQPGAAATARSLVKEVPREIASNVALGAGAGALLEGGIAANTAPEGEGRNAFIEGAGHGALTGALGGVGWGVASKATRNATGLGMKALSQRAGMGGETALKATQARGLGATLKDVMHGSAGGAPMGRSGAVAELGSRATNLAGDFGFQNPAAMAGGAAGAAAPVAGMALRPEDYQQRTAEERPKRKHPNLPDPITLAQMMGSGVGAATTGVLGNIAQRKWLGNKPTLNDAVGRFAPLPGAVGGAALGHYLEKRYGQG